AARGDLFGGAAQPVEAERQPVWRAVVVGVGDLQDEAAALAVALDRAVPAGERGILAAAGTRRARLGRSGARRSAADGQHEQRGGREGPERRSDRGHAKTLRPTG